jgi:hypothetical protein
LWNSYTEHVIDGIPNLIKLDIEDQWNRARKLEDATDAEKILKHFIFSSCCDHRCPRSDLQMFLTNTTNPNILDFVISNITQIIKRRSRIRSSLSSN